MPPPPPGSAAYDNLWSHMQEASSSDDPAELTRPIPETVQSADHMKSLWIPLQRDDQRV